MFGKGNKKTYLADMSKRTSFLQSEPSTVSKRVGIILTHSLDSKKLSDAIQLDQGSLDQESEEIEWFDLSDESKALIDEIKSDI